MARGVEAPLYSTRPAIQWPSHRPTEASQGEEGGDVQRRSPKGDSGRDLREVGKTHLIKDAPTQLGIFLTEDAALTITDVEPLDVGHAQ